jgi:hypothetical protein
MSASASEDGRAGVRPIGGLAAVAWVTMLLLGLGLPFALLLTAVITAAPFESSAPRTGISPASVALLLGARLTATAASAIILMLAVLARGNGAKVLLVWVPGIVAAGAALLLWWLRPA